MYEKEFVFEAIYGLKCSLETLRTFKYLKEDVLKIVNDYF